MILIYVAGFCVIMYFVTKWIEKHTKIPPPDSEWRISDEAFLAMCCRRSGMNIGDVFYEAALMDGFKCERNERWLVKDISLFLRNSDIPPYVRKFIDEGRKEMCS